MNRLFGHRPQADDAGPGVPEALPRTLRAVGERLGPTAVDRLWVFPPLVRARREWGLVAAGCFEGRDVRRLVTASYSAERTGKGLFLEMRLLDEGLAPPDRLPRVMAGVVGRTREPLGHPRVVEIGGAAEAFDSFLSGFGPELFAEAVAGPPVHRAETGVRPVAGASSPSATQATSRPRRTQ